MYPSGNIYTGEWYEDARKGKGTYIFYDPPTTDEYLVPPGSNRP